MKQELKRIAPLRAANISALVYGLLTCVFMLLFSPFFLFAFLLGQSEGVGLAGPLFAFIMLVIYPIMGFVMGWIMGLVGAAIYNLVVRWTGGLLLEFKPVQPDAGTGSGSTPVATETS